MILRIVGPAVGLVKVKILDAIEIATKLHLDFEQVLLINTSPAALSA